ncbi:Zn-dependent alcohol dehydrogenase domain-containing protein (plasmid) [Rhizobium sp. N541]|nr:Zn-dependent alcohol dehydrogenase domain-containing protein [Rhizobium sp. N541]ANM26094.1 Zn-dependent alcohol dehydrogenase domain-containing protein [Rhizobium sp. N941]
MRRPPVANRGTRRLTKGHFSVSEGFLVSSDDGACVGLRDAVIGQWEVFLKAAIYDNPGPPSVLVYADVPDPVCGPDEVLISVEAI